MWLCSVNFSLSSTHVSFRRIQVFQECLILCIGCPSQHSYMPLDKMPLDWKLNDLTPTLPGSPHVLIQLCCSHIAVLVNTIVLMMGAQVPLRPLIYLPDCAAPSPSAAAEVTLNV